MANVGEIVEAFVVLTLFAFALLFFFGLLPCAIVYFVGFELGRGSLWAILTGIAFALMYLSCVSITFRGLSK